MPQGDTAFAPGALIEAFTPVDALSLATPSFSNGAWQYQTVHVTLPDNPTLAANTRYWIGITTGSSDPRIFFGEVSTLTGTTGTTGEYAATLNNNTVHATSGDGSSFQLQVTVTDVPEPASIAMLGVGLAGLFAARRRQT